MRVPGLTHALSRRPAARPVHRAGPKKVYVICTNPRSGSWLLSEGLTATGIAGRPREWLNPLEIQRQRARWRLRHDEDLPARAYLGLAAALSTTPNGVSGVKIHAYQMISLPELLVDLPGFAGLAPDAAFTSLFPDARHVWLQRRDRERQAVSLWRAFATNRWWSIDGVTLAAAESTEPSFDASAIARMEAALTAGEQRWRDHFKARSIDPLVIHYEDLVADYQGEIGKVLDFVGLAVPAVIAPPRLARQADATSEDYLSRYLAGNHRSHFTAKALATGEADLSARGRRPPAVVSPLWHRWIALARMRGLSTSAIAAVLTSNGHDPALAEQAAANGDMDACVTAGAALHRRLRKFDDLVAAQRRIARLRTRPLALDRSDALEPTEFLETYYAANRPALLTAVMRAWNAPAAWTPDYLDEVVGDVELPLAHTSVRSTGAIACRDLFRQIRAARHGEGPILLPAHGLLRHPGAERLLQDLSPLPPFLTQEPAADGMFLWLGPAGASSPWHLARQNVLLAQIFGRRHYRLFPPLLGPADRSSQPLAVAEAIDVVVGPLQALFVPVGWGRTVRALDTAATVGLTNFIFPNQFEWETP